MTKTAYLFAGHGSRDQSGILEFIEFVNHYRVNSKSLDKVDYGFLEFAKPSIKEVVTKLKEEGYTKIKVITMMLLAAGHIKNDIPALLNKLAKQYKLEISMTSELAVSTKLITCAYNKINLIAKNLDNKQTSLLVVGRGTNDPSANGEVCKMARMLFESFGFDNYNIGYSGIALPNVYDGLVELVNKSNNLTNSTYSHDDKSASKKNIIVFPLFLFDGILVKRIYQQADEFASNNKQINLYKAEYLYGDSNLEPLVTELLNRLDGNLNQMNCLDCIYRDKIPAFESKAGQAQVGHSHSHASHHNH